MSSGANDVPATTTEKVQVIPPPPPNLSSIFGGPSTPTDKTHGTANVTPEHHSKSKNTPAQTPAVINVTTKSTEKPTVYPDYVKPVQQAVGELASDKLTKLEKEYESEFTEPYL